MAPFLLRFLLRYTVTLQDFLQGSEGEVDDSIQRLVGGKSVNVIPALVKTAVHAESCSFTEIGLLPHLGNHIIS